MQNGAIYLYRSFAASVCEMQNGAINLYRSFAASACKMQNGAINLYRAPVYVGVAQFCLLEVVPGLWF